MNKIKFTALLLAIVLSFCFLLTGCKSDANYPVTIGHTKIQESPVKVIALSDNIADIICYMGYASKLAGVSDACTQEEITKYITSVGEEDFPNADLIINSGATVVFADSPLNINVERKLKDAGITVITTFYPSNDAQLLTLYKTIGAALGGNTDGTEKGVDAYNRLMSILTTAQNEAATVASTKTVCYLYLDGTGKLCTYTGAFDDGMVLGFLGTTNIASNFPSNEVDTSVLKLSNPDFIFFDNTAVMEKLTNDASLKNLSAITKGNVFELKKEELTRQGESLVNVQNFMLSSMFPNFIEAPAPISEDISSYYGITLTEDMSYKAGDDNDNIIYVQQRLVDLGYLDLGEDSPTSYFGSMTEEALKSFQSSNGLEASGIASFETMKKLFSSDALGANGEPFVPEKPQEETTAPQSEASSEADTNASVEETTSATTPQAEIDPNAPITITDSTVYQAGDEHDDIIAIQTRLVDLMYLSFDEGDSPTNYYGAGTENAISNFQESNGLAVTGVADEETLRVLFSSEAKIPQ